MRRKVRREKEAGLAGGDSALQFIVKMKIIATRSGVAEFVHSVSTVLGGTITFLWPSSFGLPD